MPKKEYVSDVPSGLTGRYTTDYDIPRAHAQVLEHLKNEPDRLREYEQTAQEYIDYYEMMRVPKKITFGKNDTPFDPYALNRVQLISQYLMMARAYIPENVVYVPATTQPKCSCGLNTTEDCVDINGIYACPSCGVEHPRLGRKKTTSSVEEVLYTPRRRQDNEERENFVKALIRFQGMQKDRLPHDLMERLDAYFLANNYPTCADVRAGLTPSTCILNKDVMYKALASVGCPMYEHINLICHKAWGWALPELNQQYDTVLHHYDVMQRVAQDKNIPTINTQYRLFKHIEMVGFPCYATDFRIPKTRDIIQDDEEYWKRLCEGVEHGERLGIRFIPTL
jgi:hypothetical protein